MVILDQCGKSPQQKLLKFSQNAYLTNTKGFSKHGVGLVSGLNNIFRAGVYGVSCLYIYWAWSQAAAAVVFLRVLGKRSKEKEPFFLTMCVCKMMMPDLGTV